LGVLRAAICFAACISLLPAATSLAQFGGSPATKPADAAESDGSAKESAGSIAAKAPKLPDPEGAKALSETDRVWVDVKNHLVYVDGYVALREGYLEMFACTMGTKEHESVVGVRTKAATVHAALLAAGAVPGHPVKFRPEFVPAAGTEIEIEVRWLGEDGKWQSAKAQEWVREIKSKKEMSHGWVFGGSGFWTDEANGKRYYQAEGGELICVSNFASATLDVPFESTDSDDALEFQAFTEHIPKLGTPVRLVLKPVLEKKADAEKKS